MIKRIIVVVTLILVSFSVLNVSASEYYSEFVFDHSGFELIPESDVLKREEVKLYNTLETKRKYIGYKKECDNYDDYRDSLIISDKPIDNNALIKTVQKEYDKFFGVAVMQINQGIRLYDIRVKNKYGDIEFVVKNTSFVNSNKIVDRDTDTYLDIPKGSSFKIEFLKFESIDGLEIEFISDKPLESKVILIYNEVDNVIHYKSKIGFKYNIINFESNEEIEAIKDIVGIDSNGELNPYYRSYKREYNCYEFIEEKTNKYEELNNNSVLTDYIIKYNYYVRERVSLLDMVSIGEINNIVVSSTIDYEPEIVNVDELNEPGEYEIVLKYGDFVINHKLTCYMDIDVEDEVEDIDITDQEESCDDENVSDSVSDALIEDATSKPVDSFDYHNNDNLILDNNDIEDSMIDSIDEDRINIFETLNNLVQEVEETNEVGIDNSVMVELEELDDMKQDDYLMIKDEDYFTVEGINNSEECTFDDQDYLLDINTSSEDNEKIENMIEGGSDNKIVSSLNGEYKVEIDRFSSNIDSVINDKDVLNETLDDEVVKVEPLVSHVKKSSKNEYLVIIYFYLIMLIIAIVFYKLLTSF